MHDLSVSFLRWISQVNSGLCKALGLAVLGLFATGFGFTAQAQYYFLRNLPIYWGPYAPYYDYYDEGAEEAFAPAPFYRRGAPPPPIHRGVSEDAIYRHLSERGLHLIAPIRRKGNIFLVAAAAANGQRQRVVFSAVTGKLIDHAWLGPNHKTPAAPKPGLEKSGTPPIPPKQPEGGPEPASTAPKSGEPAASLPSVE